MSKNLYFLVEGNDDERFFKHIIKPLLINHYKQVKIWQHAQKPNDTKNRFLQSIKSMGSDYIYVVDLDDFKHVSEKKEMITKSLEQLNQDRIMVVIKEIEGWYLAGIDRYNSDKIGFTYLPDTNMIYKEDFNDLIPDRFNSRIDFMQEIIKSYSIETGKDKNDSLKYFFSRYIEPVLNNETGDQVAVTS